MFRWQRLYACPQQRGLVAKLGCQVRGRIMTGQVVEAVSEFVLVVPR